MNESRVWEKLAGYCGALAPIVTLSLIMLSMYISPSFSITQDALSKLGVTPGLPSILFNFGLVLGGLMLMPFSLKIHRVMEKGKFLGFLFSLISLNIIAIGVFPQSHPFHLPLALSFFSLLPLILITLGILTLRDDAYTVGELEIISGAAIIAVWLVPWGSKGIPELTASVICSTWVIDKGVELAKNG